jgi:hypothetical protein
LQYWRRIGWVRENKCDVMMVGEEEENTEVLSLEADPLEGMFSIIYTLYMQDTITLAIITYLHPTSSTIIQNPSFHSPTLAFYLLGS